VSRFPAERSDRRRASRGCGKFCSSHMNNSCTSCGVRAPIARSTSWRVFGLMDSSILPGLGRAAKATVVKRRCLDSPTPQRCQGGWAGQKKLGNRRNVTHRTTPTNKSPAPHVPTSARTQRRTQDKPWDCGPCRSHRPVPAHVNPDREGTCGHAIRRSWCLQNL